MGPSPSHAQPRQNTEPTLATPPALRSHLACPLGSQDDLTDPRPNTDHLPGIIAAKTLGTNYPHPASWASVPISVSGIKTQPRSPSQPRLSSPYSNSPTLIRLSIVCRGE